MVRAILVVWRMVVSAQGGFWQPEVGQKVICTTDVAGMGQNESGKVELV